MLLAGVQLITVAKNPQYNEKLNCPSGEMKIAIGRIINQSQRISYVLVLVKVVSMRARETAVRFSQQIECSIKSQSNFSL